MISAERQADLSAAPLEGHTSFGTTGRLFKSRKTLDLEQWGNSSPPAKNLNLPEAQKLSALINRKGGSYEVRYDRSGGTSEVSNEGVIRRRQLRS